MKHILFLFIIFYLTNATAQVPEPREGSYSSDVRATPDMPGDTNESGNAGYYQKDGKFGFVQQNSRQEAIYDKINFANNGFIVKKGKFYGITSRTGIPFGKIDFDSVGGFFNNSYIVKKNGKYGTISPDGKQILAVKYKNIYYTDPKSDLTFIKNSSNEMQMLQTNQEKLLPRKIEYFEPYSNIVILKSDGKFGAMKGAQTIIPFVYDSIFFQSRENFTRSTLKKKTVTRAFDLSKSSAMLSYVTLQKDGKFGLADAGGVVIYPADNDQVTDVSLKRYYTVKKNKLYGIYFTESKTKTAIEFDKVYSDGIGYVMAIKSKKAGVFNLIGEQIIPFEYDDDFIAQLSVGLRVTKNKKRGIIDTKGNIVVSPLYDDVETFHETGFSDFIKVKSDEKYGIVNLKGEIIIPVEYQWIGGENGYFKVVTPNPERKFGLFDKTGKVIVAAKYDWITDGDTENSKIIILKKGDNSFNFLNQNKQLILKENATDYGYVLDEDKLLNPFSSSRNLLLYVRGKDGKFGMLNEMTGTLDIPMEYDEIVQRFETAKHLYLGVRKGKKFGLINEDNHVSIPIIYDAIRLDFIDAQYTDNADQTFQVVVAKGKKFGTVNYNSEIQIPFKYSDLQRISDSGIFKAKVGKHYQIINAKNEVINKGPFDEVTNFEQIGDLDYGQDPNYNALTFYNGKMRVVNQKGAFITSEVDMEMHDGYETFDELKAALIYALDSKDEAILREFVEKIAPSKHILFYLKRNIFDDSSLEYIDIASVKEKYFNDLIKFKYGQWQPGSGYGYKRTSLTHVADYTMYRKGVVSNARNTDHAFGDSRFLEKVLRNAFKINGFWISSYFMNRAFNQY